MNRVLSRKVLLVLLVLIVVLFILMQPYVLGKIAAKDGTIHNRRSVLILQVGTAILAAWALVVAVFAARPALLAALVAWVRRRPFRALLIVLLAVLLGGGTAGYYYHLRNSVDVLSHVSPSWTLGGKVQEIRREQGRDAALEFLGKYFAQRAPSIPVLPYQLWDISPEESARYSQEFSKGIIGPEGGSQVRWDFKSPLVWTPPTPVDLRFYFQRQVFLFEVLAEPEDVRTNAAGALAFVKQWRRGNPFWPNIAEYTWGDDPVPQRIEAQMWLMENLRRSGRSSTEEELEFLPSLLQHADILMDPSEHNFATNHGMMQNCALLSLAVQYPELDVGQAWRRTAVAWMEEHLKNHVAADGAFREISPAYHYFATQTALWFYLTASRAGISLSDDYAHTLRKMLAFCVDIREPDGTLPLIGDTELHKVVWPRCPWPSCPDWPEIASLESAMTAPAAPCVPPVVHISRESGYAILKVPAPEWTAASAFMLTFKASPASHAHFQPDALSITLFAHGRHFLDGPGYPSFFSQDRVSQYSTVNQNTVSVDGGPQKYGDSRITFSESPSGPAPFVAVQGESALYEGVLHERTVFYGAAAGSVLLVDTLDSAQPHLYQVHFRHEADLKRTLASGEGVLQGTAPSDALLIRCRRLADGQLTDLVPAGRQDVVDFSARGDRVLFVTVLDSAATPQTDIAVKDGKLIWSGPAGRLEVELPVRADSYRWTPATVSEPAR